jgi:hypothetical protein
MRKITWFQWWSFGRRKWVDLIMTAGFWDQMKAWRLSCCLHPSIWLHIIVWDQFSENNKWNGAFDSSEYEYAKHVPHLNTNMQNVWRVTYHYVWVLGNQLNNGLCSICMHPLLSLSIVLLDLEFWRNIKKYFGWSVRCAYIHVHMCTVITVSLCSSKPTEC